MADEDRKKRIRHHAAFNRRSMWASFCTSALNGGAGCELMGKTSIEWTDHSVNGDWEEWPDDLRVREFPK